MNKKAIENEVKELQEQLQRVDNVLMNLDSKLSKMCTASNYSQIHSLRKYYKDIEISCKLITAKYNKLMEREYVIEDIENEGVRTINANDRCDYNSRYYALKKVRITKYDESTLHDDYIDRDKKLLMVLDLDDSTTLIPYEIKEVHI